MEGEIRFSGTGFNTVLSGASEQYTKILDMLCRLEEYGNGSLKWEGTAGENWKVSFNKDIDRLRIIMFQIQNLISCTNIMARHLMEVKATVVSIVG